LINYADIESSNVSMASGLFLDVFVERIFSHSGCFCDLTWPGSTTRWGRPLSLWSATCSI